MTKRQREKKWWSISAKEDGEEVGYARQEGARGDALRVGVLESKEEKERDEGGGVHEKPDFN